MTSTTDQAPLVRDTAFRISMRVLAILAATARYGVLTSDQLAHLDGGSRQKVTRILQRCVEHKLLRRAERGHELFLTSFFDARPRAFSITPKGLRTLAAAGITINVSPNRSDVLLAHEIETAQSMFAFNAAVAAHGQVTLIDQPELLGAMPIATRQMPRPLRLSAEANPRDYPQLGQLLKQATVIGVEPDRLFALAGADNTGWTFALELDRGTEDIGARRIKGKATYLRKLLGYGSAWRAGVHIRQWGEMCKALRCLVVTTSDARIGNMLDMQRHVGIPAGLILYSTAARITAHGALGPAWINTKGDGQRLLQEGV